MPRSGTVVICVQNLDFSGANQVVLNIVSGKVHESNVVVLSPKIGTFAARFVDSGAAVRVGVLEDLLREIRDVICIVCNTIMTANIVVEYAKHPVPCVWILHEWWDDEMIIENLRIRNYENLTLATVKQALAVASMCVFVCEAQRKLYNPTAPSSVIFVGVPDPIPRQVLGFEPILDASPTINQKTATSVFTFLCLGIICPRKNQLWTVELFKQFAQDSRQNVRLKVVGARYTRAYEMEYLDQVRACAGDDPRIEILDVTDNVDPLYKEADCLILTSLNEVTPMVISEALSWSIPVLSTNIAGIKEMYTDGVEGYLFSPGDSTKALFGMQKIYSADAAGREKMCKAARLRFESTFDLDLMVESYRQLMISVSPPVILLDMDGCLVDWDKGFFEKWGDRCAINRETSYYMEDCIIDPAFKKEAESVFKAKGFFENLEPMDGALEAVKDMVREGFDVYLCTSPIRHSQYCAQEKLNWIVEHLGSEYLDKAILCQDKTQVVGDILIDDKPMDFLFPNGKHTAAKWKQVLFDQPYNRQRSVPRIFKWSDWRTEIYPLVGKVAPPEEFITLLEPDRFSADAAANLAPHMHRSRTNQPLPAKRSFKLPGKPKKPLPGLPGMPGMPGRAMRDTSTGSDISTCSSRSAADVQREIDMLVSGSGHKPLAPEDMATILSNSMSLLGDDDADSVIEDERMMRDYVSDNVSELSGMSGASAQQYMEMKRSIDERNARKNEDYRNSYESKERRDVLDNDEEGVQVFRESYRGWKPKPQQNQPRTGAPGAGAVTPQSPSTT